MRIAFLLDVQNVRRPHQLDSGEMDATRQKPQPNCSMWMFRPLPSGAKLGVWRVFALCLWGHAGLRSRLRSLQLCVSRSNDSGSSDPLKILANLWYSTTMMVDRIFRSTRRKSNGILNIAWKGRQCAAHIGMPNGLFSAFTGLGIQTRLVG